MKIRSGIYSANISKKMNFRINSINLSERLSKLQNPIRTVTRLSTPKTTRISIDNLFPSITVRITDLPLAINVKYSEAMKLAGLTSIKDAMFRFMDDEDFRSVVQIIKDNKEALSVSGFKVNATLRRLRARIIWQDINMLMRDREYTHAFAMIIQKEFILSAHGFRKDDILTVKYNSIGGVIRNLYERREFIRALNTFNQFEEILAARHPNIENLREELTFHAQLENAMILADKCRLEEAEGILKELRPRLNGHDVSFEQLQGILRGRQIRATSKNLALEGHFELAMDLIKDNEQFLIRNGFNIENEKNGVLAWSIIYSIEKFNSEGKSSEAIRLINKYSSFLELNGFQIEITQDGAIISKYS